MTTDTPIGHKGPPLDQARSPASSDDIFEIALTRLHGRILDVDTHEMYPAKLWVEEFGEFSRPLVDLFLQKQPTDAINSVSADPTDIGPITSEKLADYWDKGCHAPGAYDMERRLQFMDVAGVDRALVFGTIMAIIGQQFASAGAGTSIMDRVLGVGMDTDPGALGRSMVTAHNDWSIRTARFSPRLRPVAAILTQSLHDAVKEAERVIEGGVGAVMVPVGTTIEARAPSHPDNDVLWKLLADHDVTLMFHIGSEDAFAREHLGWRNTPAYANNRTVPSELSIDAFSMAVSNLPIQNYLTNMVLGAVFERVPHLRVGVAELGASWIGPAAKNMDMWAEYFSRRFTGVLSMRPSEYITRNVRVTPFHFEPIDDYLINYPFLETVLCFSSDYPHFEGGRDPVGDMLRRILPFGPDMVEKFFVSNADWIMPDRSA
jgi:predicted TIM-barrel fold metal-dependent hydrolase